MDPILSSETHPILSDHSIDLKDKGKNIWKKKDNFFIFSYFLYSDAESLIIKIIIAQESLSSLALKYYKNVAFYFLAFYITDFYKLKIIGTRESVP